MSILVKFKQGIDKSSKYLSTNILKAITNNKIDETILKEIEDILISADLGVTVSRKLIQEIKSKKVEKNFNIKLLQEILANKIENILLSHEVSLKKMYEKKPEAIIFVGVNGSGKTTSIGKLSKNLSKNYKVLIVACDTYRAAAVEQIKEWAEKSDTNLYEGKQNQDPASVAFEACKIAKNENYDFLLIDTAGRLGNNKNLMDQLLKIKDVIQKSLDKEDQKIFLVLDSSSGNNILNQFENFNDKVGINGLIINKLDGTAKGGAIVALAAKHSVPIYFIGIGEKIEDLYPFKAKEFSLSLFNLINNS